MKFECDNIFNEHVFIDFLLEKQEPSTWVTIILQDASIQKISSLFHTFKEYERFRLGSCSPPAGT